MTQKFKETEIGMIPEDWNVKTLNEVSIITDSLHKTPEYTKDGFPMVRVTDLAEGFLDLTNALKVDPEVYEEFTRRYKPKKGDIIISRVGSYGIPSYVNSNINFCLGQNTASISPKIDKLYLFYCLRSVVVKKQIEYLAVGSTQKTLSLKNIQNLLVPVCSNSMQKKIADCLYSLDDKIDLNRQMNSTLEQIAQTLFKHWFIDFEFPDENGNLYKSSGGRMVDSELGEIPEGWKPSSVGAEFDITMGQSPPGDTYNENKEGELFFQGRRDFGWRYPENRIYCTQPNRMAKKGDTLLSVRAPVGDINKATSDCCIGRGLAALRHKSGCEAYTYYSLMELSRNFRNFNSEGTVFGSINQKDLKALKILKPSSSIVELFTNVAGVIDQQILSFDIQNRTLSQLRDSLLPKLMSGKIRVEC